MHALLAIVTLCVTTASSYPHYSNPEFFSRLQHRQIIGGSSGSDGSNDPPLIGDLKHAIISQSAKDIVSIFLSDPPPSAQPQNLDIGTKPVSDVSQCDPTDSCCPWFFVSEYLTSQFVGSDGLCNDLARAAIRLGFHDAGTWSQSLAASGQDFGGADGSFVLFGEDSRPENSGLGEVTQFTIDTWDMFPVGMADLIQYMAVHAVVTCPLGPRVRAYVGRIDATQQSPRNLLPDVHADADSLIALFEDKTISPHELAALLGAHSTSKQFFVDTAKSGMPQDTTPGIWDVSFYNETLQQDGPDGVFKFPSDVVVSQHPRVSDEWLMFTANQTHWNEDFARAYLRLSLLGVNNINQLTECTHTLPPKQDTVPIRNTTTPSNTTTSMPPFTNATSVPLTNSTSTPYANATSTPYLNATSTPYANTTSAIYTNTTTAPTTIWTPYPTSSVPYSNATASAYANSTYLSHASSNATASSYVSGSYLTSSTANYTSMPYGNTSTPHIGYTATPTASRTTYIPHYSSSGKPYSTGSTGAGHGYSTSSAKPYSTHPASYPTGSKSHSHSMVVTVITTSYVDICTSGLKTVATTYTTTVCPEAKTTSHAIPKDWTTYVTVCTHCYSYPTTLTLTKPTSASDAYHAHSVKPTQEY